MSQYGVLLHVYRIYCILDGLSIPFFNIGRRTVSLTSSWSRPTPSRATPEWLTLTRRIVKPVGHTEVAVDTAAEEDTRGETLREDHQTLSESPTLVVATQPGSSFNEGRHPDTIMKRTTTNQSARQVEFDASLVVEGKRVIATDALRLPSAVRQRNGAAVPELEGWRENPSFQNPSSPGPPVSFRE